ncbi:hypothetical protein PoB_004165200 [Plakobranchus ocellatus]|uniref:Uncharacterized protein n=1 Tax=Plakobranchus ocellatus TaxID=259542 RepID=A0AAV4B7K5_9GAST|nr:hypothetical protein PoB_004165200 [Plakobranchus ocellatus]
MLVRSRLSFERSQQRSPRMAAEVAFLPRPRGKQPRRILRLSIPREQQKLRHQPSAGPKSRKDRRPPGNHFIVLRLWPWNLRRLYPESGGIPPPPASRGPLPPLWSTLSPPPNPNPPPHPTPRPRRRNRKDLHLPPVLTKGVKPTKKIEGLAGQPKGELPSNK